MKLLLAVLAAGLPSVAAFAAPELFELQELRAQLRTVVDRDIPQQSLSTEKRKELSGYVRTVVERAASPVDVAMKADAMGVAKFVAGVEGRSWRMAFSTEGEGGAGDGAEGLPYGSTVLLRVRQFAGTEGKLDYVLKFSERVLGLNELVAKSACRVDIGPVNPGLFTFEYEDIKTNVFGIANIPVGFFGLLKGRVSCIDTVWFDGEHWIERNYRQDGDVVYSVYIRDTADEEERARP